MRVKATCAITRGVLSVSLSLPITLSLLFTTSIMGESLSKDLQGVSRDGLVDVIIQFTLPPTADDLGAVTHSGAVLKHQFPNIRGASFTVPAAALRGLASNPRRQSDLD